MAQIITNDLATTASENIELIWKNIKNLYSEINKLPSADELGGVIQKITENIKNIELNKNAISDLDTKKQDKLVAGENVKIDGNVISMQFTGDVKWDAKNADLSDNDQYQDIVGSLTEIGEMAEQNREDISDLDTGLTLVNTRLEPVLNDIKTLLTNVEVNKNNIASNKTDIANNTTKIIANENSITDTNKRLDTIDENKVNALTINGKKVNTLDTQYFGVDENNTIGVSNVMVDTGNGSQWLNTLLKGIDTKAGVKGMIDSKQDKLQTTTMTITDDNGTAYTFKVIN